MPTTSNFGWTTPADTDLVKDGAAAIRTLGNGIDTSLVDLKGGTTGQNLRKASNTDLDFTFAGDATNTVIDAAGDLLYGTAADTLGRLAIGTAGQVLKVNSGATAPEWATIASGGKVLQVLQDTSTTQESTTSESYVDTDLSQAITPSAATSKILVIAQIGAGTAKNSTTVTEAIYNIVRTSTQLGETRLRLAAASANLSVSGVQTLVYLDSPNTTSSTTYKVQFKANETSNTAYKSISSTLSSLTLIEIGA